MSVTRYLNSQIKRNQTSVYEIVNPSNSKHICYVRIPNQIYFFNISIEKVDIAKFIVSAIYDTQKQSMILYSSQIVDEILSSDKIKVIKVEDNEKMNYLTKFLALTDSSYIRGDTYDLFEINL